MSTQTVQTAPGASDTNTVAIFMIIVLALYVAWLIFSFSDRSGIYKEYKAPDLQPNQYHPITDVVPLTQEQINTRRALLAPALNIDPSLLI
jgi:hypothetical protein